MVLTKRYLNTTHNPNIEQFALTPLSMFTHAPNQIEDPVTARDEAYSLSYYGIHPYA